MKIPNIFYFLLPTYEPRYFIIIYYFYILYEQNQISMPQHAIVYGNIFRIAVMDMMFWHMYIILLIYEIICFNIYIKKKFKKYKHKLKY